MTTTLQTIAKGAITGLTMILVAGGATAQEAGSASATETGPSGLIADFNDCFENNASALVPQADLIRLCVSAHAKSMDRGVVRSEGAYRQTENGLIFVLRMQNSSPDTIITGYSVILKHQEAEQPQIFNLTPVSILPGAIVDVPLGGLTYVPAADDIGADRFQFGVDGVRGITLALK